MLALAETEVSKTDEKANKTAVPAATKRLMNELFLCFTAPSLKSCPVAQKGTPNVLGQLFSLGRGLCSAARMFGLPNRVTTPDLRGF
jgi:hypothetical protein